MKTIRALRQERGWTQFELAIAVGVQPQTIYLWESGRRLPQVIQMRKLGEVFGLCSDEIDLGPPAHLDHTQPHQTQAKRLPDLPVPGRDQHGRPTRRAEGEAARRDEH
jgi:DNA-binding XRE family transcriptional regulator